MKKIIKYSIILPCLNELENLKILIRQIKISLKKEKYEIIIVDEKSIDGTQKYFQDNKKVLNNNKIRFFSLKKKTGLAKSIYLGIKNSFGKNIVVMDSDCNHRVEDLRKLILVNKKYNNDLTCGSRFVKNGASNNLMRHFLSYFFNKIVNIILNGKINDNLSGFFIFNKEKIKKLKLKSIFCGYGEYYIRLLYYSQKNKYSYKEIGVKYGKRVYGSSKSKFIKMFFIYLTVCVKLRNEKD